MEKPHSPIVAVLVNFHSGEDTLACIHSIRTQESQAVFFVVVDNSQPGDARLDGIDVEFSNLVLLRNTANIGFGRANNQGIAWAQANLRFDYLILINNDTLIEKDAFSALTHVFSEHTSTGISTGKILYAVHPDLVWYGGAKINRKKGWPEIADFNQKATEEGANCAREVEFISGCLMCFSAQSIEDLKGFDPDFFMYCEDLEWSLRVAKSAYGMRYTPEAVIYHKVHGSGLHKGETPKNLDVRNPNVAFLFFHLKTNQYRAIRRHFGLREFLRFLLYFWGRYAWFELKMLLHGKFAFLGTSMKTRWAILKIVFTEKRHR